MTERDPIVIAGAARTPVGGFQGDLKDLAAPQLGAAAVRAALERAGVPGDEVDEVFMGCVLPAGVGQAPARQAALGAGISESVGCTTVNKVCGSGMKAAMLAHDLIAAGSGAVIVAGGMPPGSRTGDGSHVPRRPGGRLRPRAPHGHLCRGHRSALSVHPRGPGRLRGGIADPRPGGNQGRPLRR
jgi:acetyl-CoA C-acetyltransferase